MTIQTSIADGHLNLDVERDGQITGVDIQLPTDAKTVKAACSVLMMKLAGVSQGELEMAASLALIEKAA